MLNRDQHYIQNNQGVLSNNRHFIADTQAEYQPNGDGTTEGQALHIIGYCHMYLATKNTFYLTRAKIHWQAYVDYFYKGQAIPETSQRWICNWIVNSKEPVLSNWPINPVDPTQGGYKCVPLQFTDGLAQIPHGGPFWGEYLDVATFAHRGVPAWEAINAGVRPIVEDTNGPSLVLDFAGQAYDEYLVGENLWDSVLENRVTSMSAEPYNSRAWVNWEAAGLPAAGPTPDWSGNYAEEFPISWINVWTGNRIGIGPGPDDQLWSGEIIATDIPEAEYGQLQLADDTINGVFFVNYAVRLPVEHGGYLIGRNEPQHNRPIHTPLLGSVNQMGNAADAEVWFIDACYLLWRITGESKYKKALDCVFYTAHEYTYIDQRDKFFRKTKDASTPFTDGISYDFSYPEELVAAYGRDEDGYITIDVDGAGQHFLEQQAVWFRVNADEGSVSDQMPLSHVRVQYGGSGTSGAALGCKVLLDLQPEKGDSDTPNWYALSLPKSSANTPNTYDFPLYSFAVDSDDYIVADYRAVTEWGDVAWADVFESDVLDGRSATIVTANFSTSDAGLIIGFWLREPSLTAPVNSIVYRASHPMNIRIVDDNNWRWYWLLPATAGTWVNFTIDSGDLILSGYQPDHPSDPSPSAPVFTELDQIEVRLENDADTSVEFSYYCINDLPPLFTDSDGWTYKFRLAFRCTEAFHALLGDCTILEPRLDSLAYCPGIIPFSNIYAEGTPMIGYWHGMPYPGYQYPLMYCLQPDERYDWWLQNQIDFLWDSQEAYWHQTNEMGPGCAAYVWNRSDNYKYGGQVPTPFFGSTFGDAAGFGSTFTYKCASSARLFVEDEGGALWEFTLPAAADWTAITPSSHTLYSGTPSGSLIWSTEPLRLISKSPFSLRLGDDLEFPQSLYDYHTTYHWGDGKPWAGYQPRAFNAAARAWYELAIREKSVPPKLKQYVERWIAWLIQFVQDSGGVSPSEFPVAPNRAQPDPDDFTGHMCGLWLAGCSYAALAGCSIDGLESLMDDLAQELINNQIDTGIPNHIMNGAWSPAPRVSTGNGVENNGMAFGFYTGEIYRGYALYMLFKTNGPMFSMYSNCIISDHSEATINTP